MSEETAVEATDPVDSLPEEQMDFSTALDAAFAQLENPDPEPEPEPEEAPEAEVEETNEEEAAEETTEVAEEKEEPTEELESFDPTDDLDAEVGDDWTPKAASRFKQLKAELKASTEELETLRQQMAENESKVKELSGEAESADLESLQKKLAEYEREKMFTDLEETEAYKAAVADPLDKLIDATREIAEKYEVSPDELVDALAIQDTNEQDEKLSEILADATDRDRARIYRVIEDIAPILEKRASMMENASEALNEAKLAKEKEVEVQAAERAKERQNAARNVVSRVQKKLPFLSGIEGLDMKAIQEKAAEVDPTVIHPVDYTYNAVSAQILPSIIREYVGMRKENEVLTDRLAEYEGAEPNMSGSTPNTEVAPDDRSFADRVEAAFATATSGQ
jgi:hypothetical protein|tara:strand:+ start:954 stop:2138 length:1185 start_codon:yes stop_codon:yes gene_type:complete